MCKDVYRPTVCVLYIYIYIRPCGAPSRIHVVNCSIPHCNILQHTATYGNTLSQSHAQALRSRGLCKHGTYVYVHTCKYIYDMCVLVHSCIQIWIRTYTCIHIIIRTNPTSHIPKSTCQKLTNPHSSTRCALGDVQPNADRVAQHPEMVSKFFPTNQNSAHGIYDQYQVINDKSHENPGTPGTKQKVLRNNLKILCHPICNWLYDVESKAHNSTFRDEMCPWGCIMLDQKLTIPHSPTSQKLKTPVTCSKAHNSTFFDGTRAGASVSFANDNTDTTPGSNMSVWTWMKFPTSQLHRVIVCRTFSSQQFSEKMYKKNKKINLFKVLAKKLFFKVLAKKSSHQSAGCF